MNHSLDTFSPVGSWWILIFLNTENNPPESTERETSPRGFFGILREERSVPEDWLLSDADCSSANFSDSVSQKFILEAKNLSVSS